MQNPYLSYADLMSRSQFKAIGFTLEFCEFHLSEMYISFSYDSAMQTKGQVTVTDHRI